jgi:bifunctional DNA-binding transcriptional regulator/antitoxin component of YhaV-PrlF toxin-antitoxin module
MPRSTITSKRQTTVQKGSLRALDARPGDPITCEVNGGHVAVTAEGSGSGAGKAPASTALPDAVKAVREARKTQGRI